MGTRVVLYSHDSVGLGHVRRNLALAHALSDSLPRITGEPVTGLLITGHSGATSFTPPDGWDWVVVPGVAPSPGGYEARHLDVGIQRVTSIRGSLVRAALVAFAPDLLVVDRHPFGVERELEEGLSALRAAKPQCSIVLGLREVLDSPSAMEREWAKVGVDHLRSTFDAIWVYGDPEVHDVVASGEVPSDLVDLVVHTGYLAHGRPMPPVTTQTAKPFVLTMLGGGSDGRDIAVEAALARVPVGHHHLIVTGPQMNAAHHAEVELAAGPETTVLWSVPDAPALVRDAAAVVCMGGYNSLAEVLTTTTPALVVPRSARRQEQHMRATAMAEHRLVETLPMADVTADRLAHWFDTAAGTRVVRSGVDLDGLYRIGALADHQISATRDRVLTEALHAV